MRVPARHTWPPSSYWPAAFAAAASRSASSKTTRGPLPPSSAVNGTRFFAAETPIRRPASGDPVKETRRNSGCATSAAPASSPIPCTTLKTPGGKSASAKRSARSEHESGDHSAGFRTTVQPAARAGAVFQVESINGAFHGVITAAGPAGMRCTRDDTGAQRPQQHGHVHVLDGCEPVHLLVYEVCETAQVWSAAGRPEVCPVGEGVVRGAHRFVDLVLGGARDLAHDLAVDRRDVLEAPFARDACAADKVVGRDLVARDLDALCGGGHTSSFTVSRSSTV